MDIEKIFSLVPEKLNLGLLHVHSIYSLKDSSQCIKSIVERAKELECPAIALTDHGNMFGMYEFYDTCIENGIKPILSVEANVDYCNNDVRHLVLMAKNEDGLKAIFRAITASNNNIKTIGKNDYPLMDKSMLIENFGPGALGHGNVIATSAGISGVLAKTVLDENQAQEDKDFNIRSDADWYQKTFGEGNFYIELQYHGLELEKEVMPKLAEIANEMIIPLVISNDSYMTRNSDDDVLARAIVRTQMTKTWREPTESDKELYIKNDRDLICKLCEIINGEDVLYGYKNIKKIVSECNVTLKQDKHYPLASVPEGFTAKEQLEKVVKEGLQKRYGVIHDELYDKRAAYELSVIDKLNVNDYFLIVKDICEYGRLVAKLDLSDTEEIAIARTFDKKIIEEKVKDRVGEGIGPARGSAGGSIVAYASNITQIDPIEHGLYFSRFLSPNRVSMPDIDIDIETKARPYCVDYMKHKYGDDCVAGIMTLTTNAGRSAFNTAGKALSLKKGRKSTSYDFLCGEIADKAEELSQADHIELDKDYNGKGTLEHELLSIFKDHEDADFIIHGARLIQGSISAKSQHAAGIIITDGTKLCDLIPLVWNESSQMMTVQCDMIQAEKHGLLKIDFLGLNTLTIITKAERAIEKKYGKKIELSKIPFEKEVMEKVFQKGETNTVFQMESPGMKNLNKRFKPENLSDISQENAMFRPGPMQFLKDVIDVRNGKKPTYLCPQLEEILSETYGAIAYQEQIMRITRDLAGFSEARADDCRRAMSKKKQSVLEGMRNAFIYGDEEAVGCVANGIEEKIAKKIFEQMMEFAKYAFNKSHSVAYGLLAYQTAWLKWHYPLEWMCSFLNRVDPDKWAPYFKELSEREIRILRPDINKSGLEFESEGDSIRFGLSMIKNIGGKVRPVVMERERNGEYKSVSDMVYRTKPDKTTLEMLISAGAFDDFCENRKALTAQVPIYLSFIKKIKKEENALSDALKNGNSLLMESIGDNLKVLKKEMDEMKTDSTILEDVNERFNIEKGILYAFISGHPLDAYEDQVQKHTPVIKMRKTQKWEYVNVFGFITDFSVKKRKSDGAEMASFTLTDRTSSEKIWCYAKEFSKFRNILCDNKVVSLKVQCKPDENGKKFTVDIAIEVTPLKDTVVIYVENIAEWYFEKQDKIKPYISKAGNPCVVIDKAFQETRKCSYLINPCITASKNFDAEIQKK